MSFTSRIDIVIGAFDEATSVIQGLMAGMFGQQMISAIASTATSAMIFNDAMQQMYVIGEVAAGGQKVLRDGVIELSEKFGQSANILSHMGTEIEAMGFEGEDALRILRISSELAIGGLSDLENATRSVVLTIRQFGLDTSAASHIADVFAVTANETTLTVTDMNTAMSYTAPMAHQLRISLDETAATLGVVNDALGIASKSGTSVRQMLSQLIDPTVAAKKEWIDMALVIDETSTFMGVFEDNGYDTIMVLRELATKITDTEDALDGAKTGIRETEDALYDAKSVTQDFSDQLRDANNRLKELMHPELTGMSDYDDALRDVEQSILQVRIRMTELKIINEDNSVEFEELSEQLDKLRLQQDQIELEKEFEFSEQLRAITEAIEGTKEAMDYKDVIKNINELKIEIDELEKKKESSIDITTKIKDALHEQRNEYADLKDALSDTKEQYKDNTDELKKSLDFKVRDADGNTQLADTLDRLQKATADLTEDERDRLMLKLFGIRGIQAYNAITGQGIDTLRELTEANESASESVDGMGAAQRLAEERMQTSLYATNKAKQSWNKFTIAMGSTFAPAIEYAADLLSKLADWLANLDPVILMVSGAVVALTGVMLILLSAITIGTAVIPAMVITLKGLAVAMPSIIIIIVKLSLILGALFVIWVVGSRLMMKLLDELMELWDQDFGNIRTTTERVMGIIGNIIKDVMETVDGIVRGILIGLEIIWALHGDEITSIVDEAFSILKYVIETVLNTITTAINVALDILEGDWDSAFYRINLSAEEWELLTITLWARICALMEDVLVVILKVVDDTLFVMSAIFSDKYDEMVDTVIGWVVAVLAMYLKLEEEIELYMLSILVNMAIQLAKMVEPWTTMLTGIIDTVKSKYGEIIEQFTGLKKEITEIFKSMENKAKKWGIDLIENFVKGVIKELEKSYDIVEDAVKDFLSPITFDDSDNDAKAQRWGSDAIENFAMGTQQASNALSTTTTNNRVPDTQIIQPEIHVHIETLHVSDTEDIDRLTDVISSTLAERLFTRV